MVSLTLGLPVLLLALAAFALIGISARQRGDNLDQHLTARGSQNARKLGLSFLASGMGAWILFVPPEIGAFVGIDGLIGYALAAAAPFAALAFAGPALRRSLPHGRSLSEFTQQRFGAGFHWAITAVSVLYMLTFLTAELTAVGALADSLTGIDGDVVIVLLAAVTLAYTTVGGLRASLRTDAWQAWLIVGLLIIGAVAGIRSLPDVSAAWRNSGLLGIDASGLKVALTLLIAVTAANLFHQGYWQRTWSAQDDRALRRGGLLGAALTVPVMLAVGATGILAVGAGLDLGTPPAPYFALLQGMSVSLALVVFLLGVALVASSVDTLQVGLSALTVTELPGTNLLRARVLTAAAMVPVVIVALLGLSVLRIFLVADLLATAAVVPALIGLWPRATTRGAIAGVMAGLVGAVAPDGIHAATFPDGIPTLAPFLWALVASAVVTVVVSLATRPTREDLARVVT